MVIKSVSTNWIAYSRTYGVSGVLLSNLNLDHEYQYMLFSHDKLVLKLVRLLGRRNITRGITTVTGRVRDYLR